MAELGKVTSLPAMIQLVEQAKISGRPLQANEDNSLQFATLDARIDRILSGIGKSPEWHAQRDADILAKIKTAIDKTAQQENELGSFDHGRLLELVAAINVTSGHQKTALSNYESALVRANLLPQPNTEHTATTETAALIGRSYSAEMDLELATIGSPSGTKWGESLKDILELKLPGARALPFGKQAARDEACTILRSNFNEFFEKEISTLKNQLPKGSAIAIEFDANAKAILQEIATDCFSKDSTSSSQSLAKSALQAQYEARKSLIGMRDFVVGPASTTKQAQIVPFMNTDTGSVAFNVISKAPPIETAVFSGGGMKATGVGAAVDEFIRFGKYENVKKLVGSSAGALTSTFLATNISIEKFNQLNSELASWSSAFGAVDDQTFRISQYQGLHLGTYDGLTHSMGLLIALDHETVKSVDQFLNENRPRIDAAVTDGTITQDDAQHLLRLLDPDLDAPERDSSMVTFRDLKLLNSIAPEHFRQLALTGFEPDGQATQIFDADRTPDLPIAYAARASMAAPLAFTSATIDGVKYIDGGLGTNQPVDVVHGDKTGADLEESHAKTVLFSFDADGATMNALHRPTNPLGFTDKYVTNPWMSLWGKENAAGADIEDAVRQNQTGPQTLIVYHGDLGSFSFLAGDERKDFAIVHSRLMMQEQLLLRENQGLSRVYENVADVAKALSNEDRAAFLRAHADVQMTDDNSSLDPVTTAIYDLISELRKTETAT